MKKTVGGLLGVLSVVSAVSLWLFSGSVAAQSGSGEPAGSAVEFVHPAVEFYALDYSVSQQEARRRLDRIGPLQVIMASIRDLEGSRVAGWGIDHSADFGAWVWLTGDQPPGEDATRIAASHGDVEIRTGAVHAYEELRVAQDGFDPASLGKAVEDAEAVSRISDMVVFTAVDMEANALEIGIDPALATGGGRRKTRSTPAPVSDEVFEAEADWLAEVLDGHVKVGVTVADGRGFDLTADFIGGEAMSRCTAGFTAKKPGGDYGIITAGHCYNSVSMHGVLLPYVNGWKSDTADAQFHRIPERLSHRVSDDYKCSDSGERCDVTGVIARTDMMGDYVCYTGKRTGISCGTISNIRVYFGSVCFDSSGVHVECQPVYVRFSGSQLKGCSGDSGGPVYNKWGVAYGIELGSANACPAKAGKTSSIYFSAIREVEDFLGVKVLTEDPPQPAPRTPSGLKAAVSAGKVSVSWTAPIGDVAGYVVYRRWAVPGQPYREIGRTKATAYSDPAYGLTPGVEYYYRVKAVDSSDVQGGWGKGSNYASATTMGPEGLKAAVSAGTVSVSWTAPIGNVGGYVVYRRKAVPGQPYSPILSTTATTYSDPASGLTPGAEYYYRVKAIGRDGVQSVWGKGSNYASVTTMAPGGLKAVTGYGGVLARWTAGYGGVSVSWTAPIGDVAGYVVYRRKAVPGQPYREIGRTTATTYSDPAYGLIPGMKYYYRVKAIGRDGVQGGWGKGFNYASVTTMGPEGLKAVAGYGGVSVRWNAPIGYVAGYVVYRRKAVPGQPYREIGRTTATTYSDPAYGLIPGVEYYYRVRAIGRDGVQGGWGKGSNYARERIP